MKFISKIAAALAVALAAFAMGAPAKAQSNTYHEVDNVVLQGSFIGFQGASAAAAAASTGTDVASKATADAQALNLGNTSSLDTTINATAYQPNGNMESQVDAIVGQLNMVGGQSAGAVANANAVAASNASALAANIGNSAVQKANIASFTSQH